MTRILVNNTSLVYGIQSAQGTNPSQWSLLEPNSIKAYGAEIKKVARRPISKLRSRRKGTTVDLDAKVEFEGDITLNSFADFAEGLLFAEFANKEFRLRAGSDTTPPPATSSGYTIDAASATLAGKVQWVTASYATLVFAKGYTAAANNGLKPITADLASSGTLVTVSGNSAETPATSASLQVAGVRILDDADLTLTVSGSTATLVSAAAITDWSTLGLFPGMFIHLGSATAAGLLQNALGAAGTVSYGYARIVSISGATLNLDKIDSHMSTAVGPASGLQDVLFNRFLRNVSVDAASTDNRFLERFFQFELTYPDLGGVGTPQYEYTIDCLADAVDINLPLTDKGTASWSFVGTNADDITSSRKTGASAAVSPLRVTAFGTASDVAVLSTDLISSASDVAFKSLTLSLKNNVSAEKALGTLGARFMNEGLFEVSMKAQLLFTSAAIINAIKNNTTTTFLSIIKNDDGAIALDIPSLTFGDGKRDFPLDKSVLVDLTGDTFRDSTYGYDLGISLFYGTPTVRS